MNKQLILPLVVIGLCSSMLLGCNSDKSSQINTDVAEVDSVEEISDSIKAEAQEVRKPILYAKVTKDARMREETNKNGQLICTISTGDTVEIVSENTIKADRYDWIQIKYNNQLGYVITSRLKTLPPSADTVQTSINMQDTIQQPPTKKGTEGTDTLQVVRGPKKKASISLTLDSPWGHRTVNVSVKVAKIVIVGALAGILVFTVIAIIVLIFIRRKRKNKGMENESDISLEVREIEKPLDALFMQALIIKRKTKQNNKISNFKRYILLGEPKPSGSDTDMSSNNPKEFDSPEQLILCKKDIQIIEDEQEYDKFVKNIVTNYYAPYFKKIELSITDDNSDVSEWIKKLLEDQTNSGQCYSLPLIATSKRPSMENEDKWKEYKYNKSTFYYMPLPLEKDETGEQSVDAVFSEGDTLIDKLIKLLPATNEALMVTDLDVARDKEKNAYAALFKIINDNQNETDPQQVKKLQRKVNELENKLETTNNKLKKTDEDKKSAIKNIEENWCEKYNTLKDKYSNSEQQADQYKQKWMDEERIRKDHEATITKHKQTITDRDQLINRLQIEAKLYTEKVIFFRSAQKFAQRATVFFDTLDQLLANANRLKMNVPTDVNVDDYNYYLMRIERKFYTSMAKLAKISQWRFELQLLAQQALVPADGLIDKQMVGGKVKENEWESTLRMLFYHDITSSLAGAAVVMSDELALMLPHMVSGVSGTDEFAKITEKLRKAIADMGYELNYVKPFTRLNSYKDVQNVEYTKADVPQGTVFEVLKMALNFGSNKSKTEVSAK